VYGQDHIHRVLIGETEDQHDAVGDAIKSMRLLQLYNSLKETPERFDEAMVGSEPHTSPSLTFLMVGMKKKCSCNLLD
jgi:hypothetical protein